MTATAQARKKKGRDNGVRLRRQALWTRDELLRLLRAWRDTLLQLKLGSGSDPRTAADEEREEEDEFEDVDVDSLAFERFVELSSGCADAAKRQETSATRKKQALLRVFRHIQEYNQQQDQEQDSHASSVSQRDKRKKNRKKQQPKRNHWLALTLEQQAHSFESRYPSVRYVEIDQEMFSVLAVVDREAKMLKARRDALPSKANVLWTKGEVWVLINAWRQVIESRPKARDRNSHIAMLVFNQFMKLSKDGMPKRGKHAVRCKLQALVKLYKVISKFNWRRYSNGPHADHDEDTSDWFASPPHVQAQYIANLNQRVANISELDQDTFNAMEMIMKYEDSLQTRSNIRANTNQEHQECGQTSHNIVDILSDSESFGIGGSDDSNSDWEILPANPGVPTHPRRIDSFESRRLTNAESRRASYRIDEPGEAVLHQLQGPTVSAASGTGLLEVPGLSMFSEGETAGGAPRKRAKTHSEQLSSTQVQTFLETLAKLKKERKANKAKRRKERDERKEFMQLIAQEREERERDREERQKERQEWVLERDKLKFKLKKMRERYKKATRKLKSSSK